MAVEGIMGRLVGEKLEDFLLLLIKPYVLQFDSLIIYTVFFGLNVKS